MKKRCGKCLIDKDRDEFHVDNSKNDKLHNYCKTCRIKKTENISYDLDEEIDLLKTIRKNIYLSLKNVNDEYIRERLIYAYTHIETLISKKEQNEIS